MTNFAKPVAQRPQNWLAQLRALSAANAAGGTEYTVEYPKRKAGDTTPESERGVSVAITGNVETDHEGNTTGLTGWGQAVKNTSTGNWEKLGEDSGWIVPTLLNSWKNCGAGEATAAYRKQGNVVRLQGAVEGGASTAAIFDLPTGFRPLAAQSWPVAPTTGAASVVARVKITAGGAVEPTYEGTGKLRLDVITFTID